MDKAGPSKARTIDSFFYRVALDDDQSVSHQTGVSSIDTESETQCSAGVQSTSESDSEGEVRPCNDGASYTEGSSNSYMRPYKPKYKVFPKTNETRSFQQSWFKKWPWLEWDEEKESAFCHPCRMTALLKFKLSKKLKEHYPLMDFKSGRMLPTHSESMSHPYRIEM